MIGISSSRTGWFKFRIAESLGPGEHDVDVGCYPPVKMLVYGTDYDEHDRPTAEIDAWHPDIEGIGWDDIWEAVRRQNPSGSLLARATAAEYQAIKNSIATFGLVQPVIVDETGNVIAGRLRKRACIELGVNCPAEVIAGLTRDEKDQLSFELDFCRKNLSISDKRRTAKFFLQSAPRNSDRLIGRIVGLDHKTVACVRGDLQASGEIPQVQQRQGGNQKTFKFPRITVNTKREEERAKSSLQVLGTDAPAKALDLSKAEELVRCKKARERRQARTHAPLLPTDSIQILHSDFRDLQIENDSVPLFLADPPYDRASLGLYEDVARFAAQKLRPDGFLLAYAGHMYLPEILAAMTAHLNWVWKVVLVHQRGNRHIAARNVFILHRDVLVFSKGTPKLPVPLRDVMEGGGREKDFHEWQQSISEEMHFIENLTMPGDLVVSPFGGGFTTAAACHRLGRRCLTCDIDADAVQGGLERLAQERAKVNQ